MESEGEWPRARQRIKRPHNKKKWSKDAKLHPAADSLCSEYQQLSSSLSPQVSSMCFLGGWGEDGGGGVLMGTFLHADSIKRQSKTKSSPGAGRNKATGFKPLTSLLSAGLFIVELLKQPNSPLGADITHCFNAQTISLVYSLPSANFTSAQCSRSRTNASLTAGGFGCCSSDSAGRMFTTTIRLVCGCK